MTVNEMRLQKILGEVDDLKRLGMSVNYMCFSLACRHHRSLHGELLSLEQVKETYALETVPCDCKCGLATISLDRFEKPWNEKFIKEIKSQKIVQ